MCYFKRRIIECVYYISRGSYGESYGDFLCAVIPDTTVFWGSGPLNSTWRHGHFLKLTCDIKPNKNKRHDIGYYLNSTCDMRHFKIRHRNCTNSDKGHDHFLQSTCDTHRHPTPSRAYFGHWRINRTYRMSLT